MAICLFWQLKHGLGPPKQGNFIPAAASLRVHYSLHKPDNLAFPGCSARHKRSFLLENIAVWNSLPPAIQATQTLSSFRRLVSAHFASDRFFFSCLWPVIVFMYSLFVGTLVLYLFSYWVCQENPTDYLSCLQPATQESL